MSSLATEDESEDQTTDRESTTVSESGTTARETTFASETDATTQDDTATSTHGHVSREATMASAVSLTSDDETTTATETSAATATRENTLASESAMSRESTVDTSGEADSQMKSLSTEKMKTIEETLGTQNENDSHSTTNGSTTEVSYSTDSNDTTVLSDSQSKRDNSNIISESVSDGPHDANAPKPEEEGAESNHEGMASDNQDLKTETVVSDQTGLELDHENLNAEASETSETKANDSDHNIQSTEAGNAVPENLGDASTTLQNSLPEESEFATETALESQSNESSVQPEPSHESNKLPTSPEEVQAEHSYVDKPDARDEFDHSQDDQSKAEPGGNIQPLVHDQNSVTLEQDRGDIKPDTELIENIRESQGEVSDTELRPDTPKIKIIPATDDEAHAGTESEENIPEDEIIQETRVDLSPVPEKPKSNIVVVLPGMYPKTKIQRPKDVKSESSPTKEKPPFIWMNKWDSVLPYNGNIVQSSGPRVKKLVYVPPSNIQDTGSFEVTHSDQPNIYDVKRGRLRLLPEPSFIKSVKLEEGPKSDVKQPKKVKKRNNKRANLSKLSSTPALKPLPPIQPGKGLSLEWHGRQLERPKFADRPRSAEFKSFSKMPPFLLSPLPSRSPSPADSAYSSISPSSSRLPTTPSTPGRSLNANRKHQSNDVSPPEKTRSGRSPSRKKREKHPMDRVMKNAMRFNMHPLRVFNVSQGVDIIRDVFHEFLSNRTYSAQFCRTRCKYFSELIKERTKKLFLPRYKIICVVMMGEHNKQGLMTVSRCLWDRNYDNCAEFSYTTNDLWAVALLYAVYYE